MLFSFQGAAPGAAFPLSLTADSEYHGFFGLSFNPWFEILGEFLPGGSRAHLCSLFPPGGKDSRAVQRMFRTALFFPASAFHAASLTRIESFARS